MNRVLKVAAVIALAAAATWLLLPKPDLVRYHDYSRAFYDRNDRLLRLTLAADEQYRLYVPLEQIPAVLQQATLLYEDQHFYQHPGLDPLALLRAFWSSYISRQRTVGASTITMQVARLRWHLYTRSLTGKLEQILRALQLTRHYSKDQILEAYLNLASYGRNIEGVEAASLVYFNKHAAELNLPEALSLSVIPQNPVKRNPTTTTGSAQLVAARNELFDRWVEKHPNDAGQRLFFELPLAVRPPEQLPFAAPQFVNDLDLRLPHLQRGSIRTSLDLGLQQRCEQLVSRYVDRRRQDGIENAAVAILNHETMEIEALIGSADFWDVRIDGQVNGVAAKRSPGSALKPFVYALAMDQELIHPMSMLKDAPRRFAGFSPENFDQVFLGPVFAKDALISSRNLPAVELQAQLKNPGLYQFLLQSGVSSLRDEDFYGLALSLGGVELTMEELLRLYALLPNGGRLRPLHKLLEEPEESETQTVTLLSPEASYLTLDMLKDNPAPTEPSLLGQVSEPMSIAWKTGTSFAFRDAWAIGVSGPYVIAVWVGDFSGAGNPAYVGRRAAGPLLFELFRALGRGRNWLATGNLNPELLNISRVSVCADTGDLPGRYCPRETESWFIPGVSPIKLSTIHRAIPVNKKSGLRACWARTGETEMQVFEFWPSDLLQVFRQAGISIKAPPDYESDCSLEDKSGAGMTPIILSPSEGVVYSLRSAALEQERIPLSAAVDADVKELFWFVGGRYVGKAARDASFFWKPSSGDFTVRVVDDHGRASQKTIKVSLVKDNPEQTAPTE